MLHADSVSLRISKASQILKIDPAKLTEVLADEGITDGEEGFQLLNAESTTIEDLVEILMDQLTTKKLPAKAAATALKFPEGSPEPVQKEKAGVTEILVTRLKEMRPIEQWEDRTLLETFAKDRSFEKEQELNRRSKGQKFIVLKQGKFEAGKEEIDIEKTLELLKMSRRLTVPGTIQNGNVFSVVYRVTELNLNDRILEICPICGEALFMGFCEKCQISLTGISDDACAYMHLVAKGDNFNKSSSSDRKALVASAGKGLDDLKLTWPSLMQTFDELKVTNSLPKLCIIQNRPSTTIADPFYVGGKRNFGHVRY